MNFFCLLLLICFPAFGKSLKDENISNSISFFSKSDIPIMYNEKDLSKLINYPIDCITWGSQINPISIEIEKQKNLFEVYRLSNLKLFSIDTSLIQEGGKYIICGNEWNASCNRLFWEIWRGSNNSFKFDNKIKKRAVKNINGNVVGVPWRQSMGVKVPMACVNDPGYKKWLKKKIELLISTDPKSIHFDGALMDSTLIKSYPQGCFTDYSINAFKEYLKKKPKLFLEQHNIKNINTFNYKDYIANTKVLNFKSKSLWYEYQEFKLLSTAKLVKEIITYAREKSNNDLMISANVSPGDWKTLPLVTSLDFISAEINHFASNRKVPIRPIVIYKMAESLGLPMFSTAYGKDWVSVKQNNDHLLACSWISQAYASGQYMNFPLKTWIPGGQYTPEKAIYSRLAKWIKDNKNLLDDYETISSYSLILPKDALKDPHDKSLLYKLMERFIDKGVLFNIMVVDGFKKAIFNANQSRNANTLIFVLPKYISNDTLESLNTSSSKKIVVSKKVLRNIDQDFINSLSEVSILEKAGEGIFCLPRKRQKENKISIAIHLLNRDYFYGTRSMKEKNHFTIRLLKKRFSHYNFKRAKFYQFPIEKNSKLQPDQAIKELQIYNQGKYLCVDIPHLNLWGILELTEV